MFSSNFHTAFENRPAATRYKKHVEMIKKVWIGAMLPPLDVVRLMT